ncbi:uncharacterized protein LOC142056874 [Phalacrocorax aristotelis]|uniref:uncharacterized protein LOC142056874 n=1 Tax=Phalacrocorax aristotelis TaxID=126867 RepID=UPI003F4B5797
MDEESTAVGVKGQITGTGKPPKPCPQAPRLHVFDHPQGTDGDSTTSGQPVPTPDRPCRRHFSRAFSWRRCSAAARKTRKQKRRFSPPLRPALTRIPAAPRFVTPRGCAGAPPCRALRPAPPPPGAGLPPWQRAQVCRRCARRRPRGAGLLSPWAWVLPAAVGRAGRPLAGRRLAGGGGARGAGAGAAVGAAVRHRRPLFSAGAVGPRAEPPRRRSGGSSRSAEAESTKTHLLPLKFQKGKSTLEL